MFVLRRISSEGVEINQVIGNSYTVISRESNYDEFCKTFEIVFKRKHVEDSDETADNDTINCHAFISFGGNFIQPLYKNQFNFIMTDSGKTFDNVSYKQHQ